MARGIRPRSTPAPGYSAFGEAIWDPVSAQGMRLVRDRWGLASMFGINWPPVARMSDVTIAADTRWTDAAGYRAIGTLTINAGITLYVDRTPFLILCENLVFGNTSSKIRSGLDGAAADPTNWANFARGGTAISADSGGGADRAQGGGGGGILFVGVANECSGAAGVIDASGGAGYRNRALSVNGTVTARGGQGALSVRASALGSTLGSSPEAWIGTIGSDSTVSLPPHFANLLGDGGGGSSLIGRGGGSGGRVTSGSPDCAGGSGIGGGGGYNAGTATAGGAPVVPPSLMHLLLLAQRGCLGGGGGGACVDSITGDRNEAGGGGGGAVVYWVGTETTVATLTANGGASAAADAASGAAGVTHRVEL